MIYGEKYKLTTHFTVIIALFSQFLTQCNTEEQLSLIKCKNSNAELGDILEIPKHLMGSNDSQMGTFKFKLSNYSEMNCGETTLGNITLTMNESLHENVTGQFTSDGILMVHTDDELIHYRQVKDYCIQSAGEDLVISVCPLLCTNDKTSNHTKPGGARPCIHKCCQNPHKIMHITEEGGITCKNPSENQNSSLMPFLLENINNKYSLVNKESDGPSNYFSDKKFPYCDEAVFNILQIPRHLYKGGYHEDFESSSLFRLKNGNIEACSGEMKWVELDNNDLCVESLSNFGKAHKESGDLITLVFMHCPPSGENTYYSENTKSTTPKPSYDSNSRQMMDTLLYKVSLPIACIFLSIILIVYILLWDKQNIHGKTVFSYIASLFLFFFCLSMTQAWDFKTVGCKFTAVLAHFFFISTFCWLTTINFDIYWTFRKLQISSPVKSRKQFILYAIACWTTPLICVTIGMSLDKAYVDTDMVPTCSLEDSMSNSWILAPQYGIKSCYISDEAQGWYDYFVGGILLACNAVFFSLTVYKLCQHRKSANAAMKSSSQEDKPIRLFGKLLAVMGAGWIFEFIGWAIKRSSSETHGTLWMIYICDLVTLLQAVALFGIFIFKKQIFNQLWEKYMSLRCLLQIFTKNGCCFGCEVPPDRKRPSHTITRTFSTTNTLGRDATLNRDTNTNKDKAGEDTHLMNRHPSRLESIDLNSN